MGAGEVAGGVGVVDGEDAGVSGEGSEVGEGGAVGSAAQGGNVTKVIDELHIKKSQPKTSRF